mmetsp:Transcript_33247/g.33736  ORF Transcript_33247/g.33736 Transcript_33247/m.33736 type:complete len:102 (-) Transcript_33247:92-397(-)
MVVRNGKAYRLPANRNAPARPTDPSPIPLIDGGNSASLEPQSLVGFILACRRQQRHQRNCQDQPHHHQHHRQHRLRHRNQQRPRGLWPPRFYPMLKHMGEG